MKNVLIVDDNRYILGALQGWFCTYVKWCNVLTAANGDLAVSILQSTPVDMLMTDLDMPVMSGYRFIEHVRIQYPGMPMCVMTGDCSPAVVELLVSLGVKRYIRKPFHPEALARLIAEELGLSPGPVIDPAGACSSWRRPRPV